MKQQADRERKKGIEKRWQSDAEYKRLSIQRTTSKEASGLICWSIYHW